MLKKLGLIFILTSFTATAEIVEIIKVERGPREGTAKLIERAPQYNSVLLDCQSFLHGVYFDDDFFMLFEHECHEIYDSLQEWTSAQAIGCLEVDFHFKNWSLEKSHDSCP